MMPRIAAAGVGLTLLAGAARADAIDGNWCASDGRYMTIRGPQIVTPGGARLEGNYSRHAFSYVVPAREPGGGQTAALTLVDDQTVHLVLGAAAGTPELWRRCAPPTS